MPSLVDLPIDIWIDILSRLSPSDIINIRKTCRHVSSISKERHVWMSVLNELAHKNHIFKKSIPDRSTLTTAELERLATAPFQFLNKLKTVGCKPKDNLKAHPVLPHKSIRLINLLPAETEHFSVTEVFLIPGGRFLLIRILYSWVISDPRSMVVLFDLDTPKCGGYSEVARWKYGHGEISSVNQSDDGEEIRVLMVKVVFPGTPDEQGELSMTRILLKNYNTTGKSKMISLRTFLPITKQAPDTMHYNRLIGDVLVSTYPTGGLVYVWNFVEDKLSKFEIPYHDYQEVFFNRTPQETVLIMISTTHVFGWQIPAVHRRKHAQSPVTVPNPPLFIRKYKNKRTLDYFAEASHQRTQDWYDSAEPGLIPKLFDIIQTIGGGVACHRHYMKDIVDAVDSSDTSTATHTEKGAVEVSYHSTLPVTLDKGRRINLIASPFYIFDNTLIRLTHHSNKICLISSSVGFEEVEGGEPEASLVELQLLETHPIRNARNYVSTASLDMMTGRLAYISEMQYREIVVVDYV